MSDYDDAMESRERAEMAEDAEEDKLDSLRSDLLSLLEAVEKALSNPTLTGSRRLAALTDLANALRKRYKA